MAMTQQDRSAKSAAKRKEFDEKELRHRVRPGIHQKLADLMDWHGITEQSEAIQLLIINAHAQGPEGSATALALPRHEITISKNVARQLQAHGIRQVAREDKEEREREWLD
ncbi:hypothetical protein M2318_005281 [Metapseudomonas resinovorans]|uniref:hypothetical protein n=1 Tax=Metapseudomonas resinovorans TaxID=53412 RepID=UPI003D220DF3